jgi:hypothetical protein
MPEATVKNFIFYFILEKKKERKKEERDVYHQKESYFLSLSLFIDRPSI